MKMYSLEDEPSTPACNNMDKSQTILNKSSQTPFIESNQKKDMNLCEKSGWWYPWWGYSDCNEVLGALGVPIMFFLLTWVLSI